jgi:hypothetical protein
MPRATTATTKNLWVSLEKDHPAYHPAYKGAAVKLDGQYVLNWLTFFISGDPEIPNHVSFMLDGIRTVRQGLITVSR